MIARETRKVGLTGLASLVVHVPKTWANSVGLERGDEVTVVYGVGDLLIVAPPGRAAEIDRLVDALGGKP